MNLTVSLMLFPTTIKLEFSGEPPRAISAGSIVEVRLPPAIDLFESAALSTTADNLAPRFPVLDTHDICPVSFPGTINWNLQFSRRDTRLRVSGAFAWQKHIAARQ